MTDVCMYACMSVTRLACAARLPKQASPEPLQNDPYHVSGGQHEREALMLARSIYLPAYLPTCLPACLPAYLPTCLPAYLPTCLPAYLPPCMPAYLPTCLPATCPLACACIPTRLSWRLRLWKIRLKIRSWRLHFLKDP